VIGNYKIEKSIGEGTFAKVRIGKHIPTGEKVKS
jgi:serine/threonine protein kinase